MPSLNDVICDVHNVVDNIVSLSYPQNGVICDVIEHVLFLSRTLEMTSYVTLLATFRPCNDIISTARHQNGR